MKAGPSTCCNRVCGIQYIAHLVKRSETGQVFFSLSFFVLKMRKCKAVVDSFFRNLYF